MPAGKTQPRATVRTLPRRTARAVQRGQVDNSAPQQAFPGALQLTGTNTNDAATVVTAGGLTAVAAGVIDYWTVASPAGFPVANSSASPPAHFPVADPQNPGEIAWVIAASGSLWTVVRGAEGTVPVAHAPGFSVQLVISAASFQGFLQGANNLADLGSAPAARASLGIGSYPDQIPVTQYGFQGTAGITAIQTAIANRNNARLDIPVIGNSITEGQGQTVFTARWIANANRAIRATYPTTVNGSAGGIGFIPLQSTGVTLLTWPITLATGATGGVQALGPTRNATVLSATCTFTWTAPTGTTSVKILHYDYGDSAVWSYKVAAGAAVNITQSTGLGESVTADIPITGGQLLTIAWVSGYGVVEGIVPYSGDETAGITFHGCGHSGWQAGQPSDVNGWNYVNGTIPWQQSYANLISGAGALGIALTAVDSTFYSASQYQSNLENLITFLQSGYGYTGLASLPILLIIEYQVSGVFIDPGGWAAYVAAARNVAAVTPNCHVIDLSARMPSVASAWGGGLYGELYYDTFHLSNLGAALMGEAVASGVRIA